MTKLQRQKGYTLVEVAIALTIVGLLIGGTLKGEQMLQDSRIVVMVEQINAFESDTTAFKDAYGKLPGDLPDADKKIPECTSRCKLKDDAHDGAVRTAGDGRIGARSWDMRTFQGYSLTDDPSNLDDNSATSAETLLYWYELYKAGYRVVVTDDGLTGQPPSFGGSLPEAKLRGGYWVAYSDGTSDGGGMRPSVYTVIGTIIALVQLPDAPLTSDSLVQPLTSAQAARIDRKIDDGIPSSGQAQAYGDISSCYSGDPPYAYLESQEGRNCGLFFKIQH